jgi:zinc finger SWIM domain-containing protein 3
MFGDVITFYTTYNTNKAYRPFGVFINFNYFREIVVFGETFLYDESTEPFKWVFETFLAAQKNKHPKTIFADQDPAMTKVIEKTMPNTIHGLCTWHTGQNAIKFLVVKESVIVMK